MSITSKSGADKIAEIINLVRFNFNSCYFRDDFSKLLFVIGLAS